MRDGEELTTLQRIAIALERLVTAHEEAARAAARQADALERIAAAPSGKLPERRAPQRREHPPKAPARPVDEVAAARARRALHRAGLR